MADPEVGMSNSFHQCGRCARPLSWSGAGYHPCYSCGDIPENARLMSDPAAVPPPDSHEPAGRVDVSGSAPEWAVEMALAYTWGPRKARVVVEPDDQSLAIARLLASVREDAIFQAAQLCFDRAVSLGAAADRARATMGDDCPVWSHHSENEAARNGHAIVALLHTPPSGGAG